MKALTLIQPWATLVAIGAKQYETRSWSTRFRGRLAIHAAKGFPRWAKEMCDEPFYQPEMLKTGGINALPLGAVIATCELVAVFRTEDLREKLDRREIAFGGYDDGRFAFQLRDVRMLPAPIPAKGSLGFWEWDGGPSQL